MDDMILCNASAVKAVLLVDRDDTDTAVSDRLVSLAIGTIDDLAGSAMVAGMALDPAEARQLAQELLTAADRAESMETLPVEFITEAPMGRC
ncbi:hypothetical protein [Paracoccus sp. ME4]|uniref:hypothetical protein n=1 Tax=Paracoccus sp. ME4 TaxID=3138066 RepID=UPI00398B5B52